MPKRRSSTKERQLSKKEYVTSLLEVARLSWQTAPLAVSFKLFGAIIDAVLPIAITYFAAQATTQLASAYGGDDAAGQLALYYVIAAAVTGLAATAWRSLDQYVQQFMRYRVEAKVSDMMYEHFLALEFWRYDDKKTADLYDRAQKFSQFFAYIFDRVAGLLSSLISLFAAIGALFVFLPFLAVFVFIAVIPGVLIQFRLSRLQVSHWNKSVDVRRSRSFIEWELLQPRSIAELRLNNLVRHLLDLRQHLRDKDERERLTYERQFIGKRLLADAFEAAIELGSLIWITLQIIDRAQPVGQFVYVQQLVSRAITSANSFVRELSTIDEDLANLYDYQEFMKLPTRKAGGIKLTADPSVISFENVAFRYPNAKRDSLHGVSVTFKKGEHIAIVGENGAGKSTFIKLLTGLYEPKAGDIYVDGVSLKDIETPTWHRKISVLSQDFVRYGFTDVTHNVRFGDISKKQDGHAIQRALDQAEAASFVKKLPKQHSTALSPWMENDEGDKGVELSGGQWQRLALARSFYRDTPIIILDEPTSAIDALAESRIFNRLLNTDNQKTIITISHRLSTVKKADAIYVFSEGRVVEKGTHRDLVRARGTYFKMFESQLEPRNNPPESE